MITLTTKAGVIHLPVPDADALTIMGKCGHGAGLFEDCLDCLWIEAQERFFKAFPEARPKHWRID